MNERREVRPKQVSKIVPKLSCSIEELEGAIWGKAPIFSSNLVKRLHSLRIKPIGELTPEEIGLAIRQKVGLPHVLEIAVALVRKDLLIMGAFYPGDILAALIELPTVEWRAIPSLKAEFDALFDKALSQMKQAISCADYDESEDWAFLADVLKRQP